MLHRPTGQRTWLARTFPYVAAAANVALVSVAIGLLVQETGPVALPLLYVLAVLAAALAFGRGPAIVAAVLSAAAYDFLLLEPHFAFGVANVGQWIGLAVFLLTALVIGALSGELRQRAREAADREREARLLHALDQALAKEDLREVTAAAVEFLRRELGVDVAPGDLGPVAGIQSARTDAFIQTALTQAAAAVERAMLRRAAGEAEVLRRSDELKTALLHSVSHDLRTPLAAIKAATAALGDEALGGEERRAFAELIEREVDRLNRLLGNFLDLSRIEAGAVRPRREIYSLGSLVDDVVSRLAPRAPDHPVHVEIPDDLPPLPLDYVQVDQVLTNVLENALQHTPPGTEVRVTAERADGVVRVTVADRGQGVPPGAIERIFDKFYRMAEGDGRAGTGSGLGLAVARGLVEAHGGRAWAEPRPGGGLAVHFTLPIDEPR
jgi:K+-sensing histidine kinase KdpD